MCDIDRADVTYMQCINIKTYYWILWRLNVNNQAMKLCSLSTIGNKDNRLFGSRCKASALAAIMEIYRNISIKSWWVYNPSQVLVVCCVWFGSGPFVFLWDSCAFVFQSWFIDSIRRRQMTAMASRITGQSSLCFNSLSRLTTRKFQQPVLLSLCEGNPPATGGYPTERDSNAENVSIWWRYNECKNVSI